MHPTTRSTATARLPRVAPEAPHRRVAPALNDNRANGDGTGCLRSPNLYTQRAAAQPNVTRTVTLTAPRHKTEPFPPNRILTSTLEAPTSPWSAGLFRRAPTRSVVDRGHQPPIAEADDGYGLRLTFGSGQASAKSERCIKWSSLGYPTRKASRRATVGNGRRCGRRLRPMSAAP